MSHEVGGTGECRAGGCGQIIPEAGERDGTSGHGADTHVDLQAVTADLVLGGGDAVDERVQHVGLRACAAPELCTERDEARSRTVPIQLLYRTLHQLAPAQAGTPPPQIDLAGRQIRRKQVLGDLTSEYLTAA